jgi:hypothetical protein
VIVIKGDCKEGVNKSSHLMQNPLLLVMEPRIHDNMEKVTAQDSLLQHRREGI